MRELIVRPLGLVTRPNLYGQYPIGALSSAQNLVMRAPGIIEPAPATVLGVAMGAANDVVHQLFSLSSTVMVSWARTGAGVWTIYGNAVASTYVPTSPVPTFSTTGRVSPATLRDRLIVNSETLGQYVCDPQDQTPPAAFRRAGFCIAAMQVINTVTANGQALPVNSAASYAAICKRVYTDGYIVVSRPSPIITQLSGAAPINVVLRVYLMTNGVNRGQRAGDVVEVYRSDIVAQATDQTDPGTTLKKIGSVTLASADIATGYVDFTDDTVPGPLNVTVGEALYTNPGQEGALGANRFPEQARCIATFKGFAMYGHITQRPQLIFKAKGGLSWTAYAGWDTAAFRASGLGVREITGTVTLGNATVTGISATHMLGAAVGQRALGATWPANTTIQSFNAGAGTITMTAVALAGAAAITTQDVIEINGIPMLVSSTNAGQLLVLIGNTSSVGYEVTTSENVYNIPPTTGRQTLVSYIVEPLRIDTAAPLTVRASNGNSYDPAFPSYPATAQTIPYTTRKNLLTWSKEAQPEHVPVANEAQIGTGEIIAMESTRDALWIFCTDGLYRLSGAGGQWRLDTVDTTLVLSSPRASCVLREVVYCYTNQGFGRVTDAGFEPLSERVVGDLLPGAEYTETASIIVERNEIEQEIVIRLDATQVYIYSTRENSYTTMFEADVTAMAYARYPVSGSAALAFGRSPSGSTPRYELWNATASWLAASGLFQPVFAQDPFTTKQWVDGTYVFSESSGTPNITPRWNGTSSPAGTVTTSPKFVNEGRVTFGVPRLAAIGNSLAPGFDVGARAVPTKLYALSLRFRQFGEQNLKK